VVDALHAVIANSAVARSRGLEDPAGRAVLRSEQVRVLAVLGLANLVVWEKVARLHCCCQEQQHLARHEEDERNCLSDECPFSPRNEAAKLW